MSNKDGEGIPMALLMWIKKQEREKREHAEAMVKRNASDDNLYIDMIMALFTKKLSLRESIMLKGLSEYKADGRNFSTAQKSMITGVYYAKQK